MCIRDRLLLSRLGQGIGASAPRVVAQALIRDFYQGREMARISSFVMIIFSTVPALAPLLGSFVMLAFKWQAILGQFFDGKLFIMIFGVAVFAVLGAIVVHRLKRFERPHKA